MKITFLGLSISVSIDHVILDFPMILVVSYTCAITLSLMYNRRIVLGFEGEKNMPKLNFSGNLPNTIRNNILKLPVIPAGAFSNIQDGV